MQCDVMMGSTIWGSTVMGSKPRQQATQEATQATQEEAIATSNKRSQASVARSDASKRPQAIASSCFDGSRAWLERGLLDTAATHRTGTEATASVASKRSQVYVIPILFLCYFAINHHIK